MLAMASAGPKRVERAGVYGRWLRPVDALLYEQMAERRAAPGDDVLSLLLSARGEDGEPMSDQELRDELITLLVAGHETTATALSWSVERLTRAPGGWHALRDGGEEYAEAVAKEALRLRPVLPVVLRNLQQPATIAGRDLPAGTVVAPSIFLVHRRADIYPDPATFRPERFLGPDAQGGTYTWIPFGGGIRRCLGASFALMELRVVLAELAAHVDAVPARPEREPTARRAITLIPAAAPRSCSPAGRDPVGGEALVARDHREPLLERLGDEQAVERVAVVERQLPRRPAVLDADRQPAEAGHP